MASQQTGTKLLTSLKSMTLLVGALMALSPVLATLTFSISSDTICALAILLLITHLVFHDYGYFISGSSSSSSSSSTHPSSSSPPPSFVSPSSPKQSTAREGGLRSTRRFNAPISLNAAIFVAVLLSSRLPSSYHVFVLLFFAIELFAVTPSLRFQLHVCLSFHPFRIFLSLVVIKGVCFVCV